ncbi:hypothetical protein [Demequina lutea]|uniref:Nitrite reductase (NO-forming) n=1 Tax=Demequina lutea TaxID=431489 RepID=A0A7Y9Z9F4_9MICO|nr:hypothetical protein [Demequina lutea]NYI41031.1 nitrite reductase (NO-forming) [Demequina lutea]
MSKGRRGFNALRDGPPVVWLAATLVVVIAHDAVPVPRWLMIHLLLLGAVSHSVVVWSQHFSDALLRTAPPRHRAQQVWPRLLLLNVGALLVVVGVVSHTWAMTVIGTAAVITAAAAHAVLLVAQLRRSLPARFSATVRFYVAAAILLTVGAGVGAALARGVSGPLQERLHLAHLALNVLGWIGLTVLGTLVTFWPTVLGTRIDQASATLAVRALPVLVAGVGLIALGAAADQRWWVTAGLTVYVAGVAMAARGLVVHARSRPPSTYASMSIGVGLIWWAVCLVIIAIGSVTAPTWEGLAATLDYVAPFLAAGFAAQVLLGALSFLVPTVLGGGPARSRVSHREFNKGAAIRVVVINAGLLVCAFPVSALVRVIASVFVLAAFAAFLVLLVRATRAWLRSRPSAA